LSACAHSSAQRAARSRQGEVARGRTHLSRGGRRSRRSLTPRMRLDSGGPALLTEDRQEPGCGQSRRVCGVASQVDGRLGTRNTVPSRAERLSREARVLVNRASGVNPPATLEWAVDVAVIDRARVLRGWTRRDLAQRAHVDEGTLCDLFAGRRRPTFGTLRALCQALELALDSVIAFR